MFWSWLFSSCIDTTTPGGQVGDAHRRVGRVDRLAARARRPVHVDLEVLVVDVDLDLVGLGQHGDGGRRRVDPALALGDRHPLHPVRPALVLHVGPHAVAAEAEDDLVEPAEASSPTPRGTSSFHPLAGGEALVHAEEVAGEEVGLLAALGAADLDDDAAVVVRVLRQQQQLELRLQPLDVGLGGRASARAKSRSSPVVSSSISRAVVEVAVAAAQLGGLGDHRLELLVAPGHVGVAGLVGEDLGVGEPGLDLAELLLQLVEASRVHGGQGTGCAYASERQPSRR